MSDVRVCLLIGVTVNGDVRDDCSAAARVRGELNGHQAGDHVAGGRRCNCNGWGCCAPSLIDYRHIHKPLDHNAVIITHLEHESVRTHGQTGDIPSAGPFVGVVNPGEGVASARGPYSVETGGVNRCIAFIHREYANIGDSLNISVIFGKDHLYVRRAQLQIGPSRGHKDVGIRIDLDGIRIRGELPEVVTAIICIVIEQMESDLGAIDHVQIPGLYTASTHLELVFVVTVSVPLPCTGLPCTGTSSADVSGPDLCRTIPVEVVGIPIGILVSEHRVFRAALEKKIASCCRWSRGVLLLVYAAVVAIVLFVVMHAHANVHDITGIVLCRIECCAYGRSGKVREHQIPGVRSAPCIVRERASGDVPVYRWVPIRIHGRIECYVRSSDAQSQIDPSRRSCGILYVPVGLRPRVVDASPSLRVE